MEKIAVIEIKTSCVKLYISDVVRNKYFAINRVVEMPINLTKDFYGDYFIKPNVIKEINSILSVYKRIIEENECVDTMCLMTDVVLEAKNQNGFINEINVTSGYRFEIANIEEDINNTYTAIINSFNRPKGLIINVGDYNTELIIYNRRNIINKLVIPYGCVKIHDLYKEKTFDENLAVISADIKKIIEESGLKADLPEEYDIIGVGDVFKDYGSICRKAKKYPLELSHNYESNKADFEKVLSLMKNYDVNANTKIKGVSLHNSKYLPSGLIIVKSILDNFENDTFAISKTDRVYGKLFHEVLPITQEKPISDTLGYSLQMLNDYYDKKPNNSQHIYELSMILFKQLKVLHKLGRAYVKVLRIASYLSNAGYRVDAENSERVVFDIIKNSEVFGISHVELVLAAFVALGKNADNFSLSDWVRYKEYLTDEDLMAVKKLSVVLKIAEALDITGFGNVSDVSCDILGDSVIMKTIVNADAKFELDYAMLCGADFKKAFGKNLEVL